MMIPYKQEIHFFGLFPKMQFLEQTLIWKSAKNKTLQRFQFSIKYPGLKKTSGLGGSNPPLSAWVLLGRILSLSASANLCKIIFILNKLFALLVTLKTEQIEGHGQKDNNLKKTCSRILRMRMKSNCSNKTVAKQQEIHFSTLKKI